MGEYSVATNPDVEYRVAFEDSALLVVEKPSGVVTQPGKKHEHDSLLNGLFAEYGNRLQNLGESRDWGLLHRLDKDTSGLVIVALQNAAFENLLDQFKRRLVKKVYWAIVWGTPAPSQGVIQKPIREVVGQRKRAVIDREGEQAITAYKVLQQGEGVTLIEARPKTGRLHQIRVHMASKGHPVLGDHEYAGKIELPNVLRLCLHAAALSFLHPASGHRVEVTAPWPKDLNKTLKRFGLTVPQS
ncbi:MAG TPA: RluA family pseudouridine synthase [Phycisphaerae bacterium]|nr:RluA family pseudouridine synthase [Phycisphaerae bacterium]